ncbi:hypothetical protein ACFE04_002838 [Oxalis oulophora]
MGNEEEQASDDALDYMFIQYAEQPYELHINTFEVPPTSSSTPINQQASADNGLDYLFEQFAEQPYELQMNTSEVPPTSSSTPVNLDNIDSLQTSLVEEQMQMPEHTLDQNANHHTHQQVVVEGSHTVESTVEATIPPSSRHKRINDEELSHLLIMEPKRAKRILLSREKATMYKERDRQASVALRQKFEAARSEKEKISNELAKKKNERRILQAENHHLRVQLDLKRTNADLQNLLDHQMRVMNQDSIAKIDLESTNLVPPPQSDSIQEGHLMDLLQNNAPSPQDIDFDELARIFQIDMPSPNKVPPNDEKPYFYPEVNEGIDFFFPPSNM